MEKIIINRVKKREKDCRFYYSISNECFFGNNLNPERERVNNLPLNSEGLIVLNSIGKFSSQNNNGLLIGCISFFMNNSRGIIQGSENRFFVQLWKIIYKNFFNTYSCSKQFNYLPNHNSCAFESRLSMTDFSIGYYVFIYFNSHVKNIGERYINLAKKEKEAFDLASESQLEGQKVSADNFNYELKYINFLTNFSLLKAGDKK